MKILFRVLIVVSAVFGAPNVYQFSREFQIRLLPLSFSPLKSGWSPLLSYLTSSVQSKCQQKTADCVLKLKGDKSHVEEYVKYDNEKGELDEGGFVLVKRNEFEKRESSLVLKYNHVDMAMVLNSQVKGKEGIKAQDKYEIDIYPCRDKFARSIKVEIPWNQTINSINTYFDNITVDGCLKVTERFARKIIEVKAKIGYGDELIDTKFVLSATYPSIAEAVKAKSVPTMVELSFRLKGQADHRLLEISWQLFDIMSKYSQTIKDC